DGSVCPGGVSSPVSTLRTGKISLVGQLENAWPTRETRHISLAGIGFRPWLAPWLAKRRWGRGRPLAGLAQAKRNRPGEWRILSSSAPFSRLRPPSDRPFLFCGCLVHTSRGT